MSTEIPTPYEPTPREIYLAYVYKLESMGVDPNLHFAQVRYWLEKLNKPISVGVSAPQVLVELDA